MRCGLKQRVKCPIRLNFAFPSVERMCKVVNRREVQPQKGVALLMATVRVTLITVVSHPAAYVNSNPRVAANRQPDF